jgi:hypothetical protein
VWAIKRTLTRYAQRGALEFYLDLHAHANKKGVFIFGNTLEGEQVGRVANSVHQNIMCN